MKIDIETRLDPLAFLDSYQEQYRETVRQLLQDMGMSEIEEISPEDLRREMGQYLTEPNELSRAIIAERNQTR